MAFSDDHLVFLDDFSQQQLAVEYAEKSGKTLYMGRRPVENPQIQQFRRRPPRVTAARWPGGAEAAVPIIQWVHDNGGSAVYREAAGQDPEHIRLLTAGVVIRRFGAVEPANVHGVYLAVAAGEWIVKNAAPSDEYPFSPWSPEEFEAQFEGAA